MLTGFFLRNELCNSIQLSLCHSLVRSDRYAAPLGA